MCLWLTRHRQQNIEELVLRGERKKNIAENDSVPGKTAEVMSVIFLGNPKQLEPFFTGQVGAGRAVTDPGRQKGFGGEEK